MKSFPTFQVVSAGIDHTERGSCSFANLHGATIDAAFVGAQLGSDALVLPKPNLQTLPANFIERAYRVGLALKANENTLCVIRVDLFDESGIPVVYLGQVDFDNLTTPDEEGNAFKVERIATETRHFAQFSHAGILWRYEERLAKSAEKDLAEEAYKGAPPRTEAPQLDNLERAFRMMRNLGIEDGNIYFGGGHPTVYLDADQFRRLWSAEVIPLQEGADVRGGVLARHGFTFRCADDGSSGSWLANRYGEIVALFKRKGITRFDMQSREDAHPLILLSDEDFAKIYPPEMARNDRIVGTTPSLWRDGYVIARASDQDPEPRPAGEVVDLKRTNRDFLPSVDAHTFFEAPAVGATTEAVYYDEVPRGRPCRAFMIADEIGVFFPEYGKFAIGMGFLERIPRGLRWIDAPPVNVAIGSDARIVAATPEDLEGGPLRYRYPEGGSKGAPMAKYGAYFPKKNKHFTDTGYVVDGLPPADITWLDELPAALTGDWRSHQETK